MITFTSKNRIMGCSSCGGGGTPGGCKNNGTCSSGGCNKLEVYDWLANMEPANGQTPYDIVEIRFKNSRKGFYRNTKNITLQVGDVVVVETSPGKDVGVVSVVGELARIQVKKKSPGFKPVEARKILGIAEQSDIDKWIKARASEKEAMYAARTLALNLKLAMKISDVEYQADLSKATFYYTAEDRVDFRQLIKDMAEKFKMRIEMRQIGARQEAARLGGIGSCGRELCCSTWLTDFRSVSTSAARYQQLSLNPQKLAGQCGKLKCCLNYELDMYLDAVKAFPKGDKLRTDKGTAVYIKTDVFKQQMWYAYEGEANSGLIPIHPDRVREIIRMNREDKKPHDLVEYKEIVAPKEPDYANVDGQDDLTRFDKLFKKKKKGGNNRNKTRGNNQNPQNKQNTQEKGLANKQRPNKKSPNNRNKNNPNQNKQENATSSETPKANNRRKNPPRKRPNTDQKNETPT
jgi:cell fate regulator YaaT (PSP1 superfamily)